MAGMRPLTPEERAAYGLPPLSEDEQQRIDQAQAAQLQIAGDNGQLQTHTDANGNDVMADTGPAASAAQIRQKIADMAAGAPAGAGSPASAPGQLQTPGAFGLRQGPQSSRPDWQLFNNPNLDQNKKNLAAALAARAAKQPERMGGAFMHGAQLSQDGSNEWRAQQMELARQLGANANGAQPTAAEALLQQGTDRSLSGAMALARSGRGNPGVAMKQALAQQGQISQQGANQATMLRAQESQNARAQLAGVLAGGREQDIGIAGQNAQLQQQTATANAGFQQDAARTNLAASIQQQQQLDDMTKYYISTGLSLEQAQQQAQQQYENLRVLSYNQQRAAQIAEDQAKRQQEAQVAGTVFNTVGQAVGMGVDVYKNTQKQTPGA